MDNKFKSVVNRFILFLWDDRFKFESDLEISRKLMMLNYVVIACAIFLIPFGMLSLIQGNLLVGALDCSAALIISISVYYYKKTLNYMFLSYVLVIILGILFLFLLFSTAIDYSGPLWSYIFPVSVMFMLGRKKGRLFSAIYLSIVILLFFFAVSPDTFSLNFKLRFIGSFSATAVLSYYIEFTRESIHGLLFEKNNALQESLLKLAEQEKGIKEKEVLYRTLFERSSDAIFLMDSKVFIDCNPQTLEMFGCERKDIIGETPSKFSPEYQQDKVLTENKAKDKITSALKGEPQIFEWTHIRLNGEEFNAEVTLDLIELDNNKLLQARVRDITKRKIAEKELKYAKEEAEKSDRLKSDFLAQMSHEIRTPINTIMNYTSLLKMEFEEIVSEDNSGSFNSIENAARRLLRTIDLILNISDLEAGTYNPKFEYADLNEKILSPIINEFKQAAKIKNLYLTLSVPSEKISISHIDIYTVYQAISNLVDNAIKYTETGGINVNLLDKADKYLLDISDTGIGISKQFLPSLFSVFTQEEAGYSRKYEGNGLGLSLVKNYCKLNNISIDVKSEKGKGTTFTLEIPKLTS